MKKLIVLFLFFIIFISISIVSSKLRHRFEIKENINSFKDISSETRKYLYIPENSKNISYFKMNGLGGKRAFECNISEKDFENWVLENKFKINTQEKPIYDSVNIHTIKFYKENYINNNYRTEYLIKINLNKIPDNTILLDKRSPNGGGFTFLYDKNSEKLYYEASSR